MQEFALPAAFTHRHTSLCRQLPWPRMCEPTVLMCLAGVMLALCHAGAVNVAVCSHAAEADAQPFLVCCLCGGLLQPLHSTQHTTTGQCMFCGKLSTACACRSMLWVGLCDGWWPAAYAQMRMLQCCVSNAWPAVSIRSISLQRTHVDG